MEETPLLGETVGKRRSGWPGKRQLDGITDSMDMNLSKRWEIVEDRLGVLQSMGLPRVRRDLGTEQ